MSTKEKSRPKAARRFSESIALSSSTQAATPLKSILKNPLPATAGNTPTGDSNNALASKRRTSVDRTGAGRRRALSVQFDAPRVIAGDLPVLKNGVQLFPVLFDGGENRDENKMRNKSTKAIEASGGQRASRQRSRSPYHEKGPRRSSHDPTPRRRRKSPSRSRSSSPRSRSSSSSRSSSEGEKHKSRSIVRRGRKGPKVHYHRGRDKRGKKMSDTSYCCDNSDCEPDSDGSYGSPPPVIRRYRNEAPPPQRRRAHSNTADNRHGGSEDLPETFSAGEIMDVIQENFNKSRMEYLKTMKEKKQRMAALDNIDEGEEEEEEAADEEPDLKVDSKCEKCPNRVLIATRPGSRAPGGSIRVDRSDLDIYKGRVLCDRCTRLEQEEARHDEKIKAAARQAVRERELEKEVEMKTAYYKAEAARQHRSEQEGATATPYRGQQNQYDDRYLTPHSEPRRSGPHQYDPREPYDNHKDMRGRAYHTEQTTGGRQGPMPEAYGYERPQMPPQGTGSRGRRMSAAPSLQTGPFQEFSHSQNREHHLNESPSVHRPPMRETHSEALPHGFSHGQRDFPSNLPHRDHYEQRGAQDSFPGRDTRDRNNYEDRPQTGGYQSRGGALGGFSTRNPREYDAYPEPSFKSRVENWDSGPVRPSVQDYERSARRPERELPRSNRAKDWEADYPKAPADRGLGDAESVNSDGEFVPSRIKHRTPHPRDRARQASANNAGDHSDSRHAVPGSWVDENAGAAQDGRPTQNRPHLNHTPQDLEEMAHNLARTRLNEDTGGTGNRRTSIQGHADRAEYGRPGYPQDDRQRSSVPSDNINNPRRRPTSEQHYRHTRDISESQYRGTGGHQHRHGQHQSGQYDGPTEQAEPETNESGGKSWVNYIFGS